MDDRISQGLRSKKGEIDKSLSKKNTLSQKPCPWHAETVNPRTGRLGSLYCEIGPEGHEGGHLGERSRNEYMRLLRAWRRGDRNGEE
jgi:hypothetical protein